jgi:hypothetical protein
MHEKLKPVISTGLKVMVPSARSKEKEQHRCSFSLE